MAWSHRTGDGGVDDGGNIGGYRLVAVEAQVRGGAYEDEGRPAVDGEWGDDIAAPSAEGVERGERLTRAAHEVALAAVRQTVYGK
ncbi:MAG: hypothetical protein HUK01_03855 [Bacteroidaceae bacterium]|nr:hypothetical protein [Bacteroidaceae bacterium]